MLEPGPESLPFDGIKVADFSWVGVGPIAVKYLADHGAAVVRVESNSPMDLLRVAGPFKDNVPGPDRTQFFAASPRVVGHRSAAGFLCDRKPSRTRNPKGGTRTSPLRE